MAILGVNCLDFVISRDEGIVAIDNQPLAIDTSPVPANVAMVAYDCTSGAGSIEYNDRLRLLEPFIDLTPYSSYVNAWLTAATAIAAMPITLAQAKNVKLGLVDGVFNSKRQLPIAALGYTWDATDQSMLGMQSAIMAWDVAAAITNADNQFSAAVNAASVQTPLNTGVSASAITCTTSNIPYANDASPGHPATYTYGYYDGGQWTGSPYFVDGVSGGGITQQPNVSMLKAPINAPPAITGPPIDWPPLNSTVSVSLTMSQMRSLVNSIQQRRMQLQNTRLAKITVINGMTTVAGVIAYDATTGWPF